MFIYSLRRELFRIKILESINLVAYLSNFQKSLTIFFYGETTQKLIFYLSRLSKLARRWTVAQESESTIRYEEEDSAILIHGFSQNQARLSGYVPAFD